MKGYFSSVVMLHWDVTGSGRFWKVPNDSLSNYLFLVEDVSLGRYWLRTFLAGDQSLKTFLYSFTRTQLLRCSWVSGVGLHNIEDWWWIAPGFRGSVFTIYEDWWWIGVN
jgi:hypothetical protein